MLFSDGEDFDLFWVDPDLTALAVDAGEELESVHHGTIMPLAEVGFVVFARPVPMTSLVGVLGNETEAETTYRAMAWRYHANMFDLITFTDKVRDVAAVGRASGYTDRETKFRGRLQPVPLFAALSLLMQQRGITQESTLKSPSVPARKKKGHTVARKKQPDVRVVSIKSGSASAALYDEEAGKGASYPSIAGLFGGIGVSSPTRALAKE